MTRALAAVLFLLATVAPLSADPDCIALVTWTGELTLRYEQQGSDTYRLTGYSDTDTRWNIYGSASQVPSGVLEPGQLAVVGPGWSVSLTAQSWHGTYTIHAGFSPEGVGLLVETDLTGDRRVVSPAILSACQ